MSGKTNGGNIFFVLHLCIVSNSQNFMQMELESQNKEKQAREILVELSAVENLLDGPIFEQVMFEITQQMVELASRIKRLQLSLRNLSRNHKSSSNRRLFT